MHIKLADWINACSCVAKPPLQLFSLSVYVYRPISRDMNTILCPVEETRDSACMVTVVILLVGGHSFYLLL